MTDTPGQEVHRRRVMYIPGYDPVPPRKYRERYRREAAAQAAISGYDIALGPKQTSGKFGWHVSAEMEGAAVETDIEVMYWSDIVRDSMSHGILATYGQLFRTAWIYIWSGALFRLMTLRKGPVIAALYPVVFLLGQLLAALAVGVAVAFVVEWLGHRLLGIPLSFFGLVLGLVMVWAVLDLFRRQDGRFLAYYLMHDYAFSARYGGAYPPEQEDRMREAADQIAAALQADADEVLIVGHSSGAYIAVSILSDLVRAGRVPADGPRLALLTLGQVVPMVSFLPKADRLRADLAFLSSRDEITWVDVTAPGDGCAFALCDPVSVTGVAPEGKRWPLVISAAFTQTLSPEKWKALRWRLFELHFQYLNAFDQPGDYDYFRITAGPLSLQSRFADRAPSKSRIERPVNRYTSMAA
jgi:pimeloyl-ACP methyl ester carboxylesterase